MQIVNHIEIRDGTGYIVGREHLKAEMVARMVVDGDYTVEEAMSHYDLSAAAVHATLAYYYDNQHALDEAYSKKGEHIKQNATDASEHLQKIRARKKSDNTT